MNPTLIRNSITNDFPGYKIISTNEIGFPVFKKEVICLATISEGLPVAMDFTLKLLDLGFPIEDITEILSLDINLIENAYYDLERHNMIDYKNGKLTNDGKKYIKENRFEHMQKIALPINVDSYTGYVTKSFRYMTNKSAKNINLKTVKPILDKSNNSFIPSHVIKKNLKDYLISNNPEFEGKLVEIVKFNNKATEFKRLNLVVLSAPDGTQRFVVYDKNHKQDLLESKILEADQIGIKFFDLEYGDFFNSKIPTESLYELTEHDYYDILTPEIFNCDYSSIYFTFPLIEWYSISDAWIIELKKYLKRKRSVHIHFTGPKYATTHLKSKVFKVLSLKSKYSNLKVSHSINFQYAMVIFNNKNGYLNKIELFKLNLINNKECIYETTTELRVTNNDQFKTWLPNTDHAVVSDKLISTVELIWKKSTDLDNLMIDYYGVGWMDNGKFLNEFYLEKFKLAIDSDVFTTFTSQLYGCMGEIINIVGKKNGLSNYFYNDFKARFPKLHDALNRLRVYRNSMQHNGLDEKNLKLYLSYIDRDLNGEFPEFKHNGYLLLQSIIINELLESVNITIEELKKSLIY